MFSPTSKTLLKNVIRHTDTHNKLLEQEDMWRQFYQMKTEIMDDPGSNQRRRRSEDREIVFGLPHQMAHMDEESSERKSTYWMRQLQKEETQNDNRWGHGGYQELYPSDFDSDRSRSGSESHKRKKEKRWGHSGYQELYPSDRSRSSSKSRRHQKERRKKRKDRNGLKRHSDGVTPEKRRRRHSDGFSPQKHHTDPSQEHSSTDRHKRRRHHHRRHHHHHHHRHRRRSNGIAKEAASDNMAIECVKTEDRTVSSEERWDKSDKAVMSARMTADVRHDLNQNSDDYCHGQNRSEGRHRSRPSSASQFEGRHRSRHGSVSQSEDRNRSRPSSASQSEGRHRSRHSSASQSEVRHGSASQSQGRRRTRPSSNTEDNMERTDQSHKRRKSHRKHERRKNNHREDSDDHKQQRSHSQGSRRKRTKFEYSSNESSD